MPELGASGHTHVLIAPIQFLADHLEILYDIEIGARQQAEAAGIAFARTESLNTSPLFIKALAAVLYETMGLEHSMHIVIFAVAHTTAPLILSVRPSCSPL